MGQVAAMEELSDLTAPQSPPPTATQPPAAAGTGPAGAGAVGSGAAGSGASSGAVGGRAVSWSDVLPVLDLGQVEQLMGRMGQVTEVGRGQTVK